MDWFSRRNSLGTRLKDEERDEIQVTSGSSLGSKEATITLTKVSEVVLFIINHKFYQVSDTESVYHSIVY